MRRCKILELGGMGVIAEVGHEVGDEGVAERRSLFCRERIEIRLHEFPGQIGLLAGGGDRVDKAADDRARQFVGQGQRQRSTRQRGVARAGGIVPLR